MTAETHPDLPWLPAFDETREEILVRIRTARKDSDTGVYEAGQHIQTIVKSAEAYIQLSERALHEADGDDLEQLVANVRSNVVQQQEKLDRAVQASGEVQKAGAAIDGAARASRLLALNARVEASRLTGVHGAAFDVIAEEVRDLSEEIARANSEIEELIGQLMEMLPAIANDAEEARKQVETLHSRQRDRHADLEGRMQESTRQGAETLNRIMNAAQEALSALQFQDPMIQSIEGIDRLLVEVRNQMMREMGDLKAVDSDYAALLSERTEEVGGIQAKEAGEALLF